MMNIHIAHFVYTRLSHLPPVRLHRYMQRPVVERVFAAEQLMTKAWAAAPKVGWIRPTITHTFNSMLSMLSVVWCVCAPQRLLIGVGPDGLIAFTGPC
jgi:hypothetical protein